MSPPIQRLDPVLLLRAYSAGLFPMADSRDAPDVFWVEPKRRGVLPLAAFHAPRSLLKTLRQERFEHRTDTDFMGVMRACAEETPTRGDSWINRTILDVYGKLHALGHAHSVECWRDGELAGGLYGVSIGGAFFGESMFTRVRDASKCALAHLVVRLRVGGYQLLDTQFLTDHLARFGAVEIGRASYRAQLGAALSVAGAFSALDAGAAGAGVSDAAAEPRAGDRFAPGAPATTVSGPVCGKLIAQLIAQTS